MGSWRFSVGNLVARAVAAPAAVAPAAEDSLLPLSNLGDGYPDQQGGLQWRSDGAYDIDFDLNLLADESARADAPTGWLDLLNLLGGTPGLPADPPDWGSYAGRNPALRVFRPTVQEVDAMPGEQCRLTIGIHWPSGAAGATGVQVRVVDRSTGKGWDGTYGTWTDDGVVASQAVADVWLDVDETIDADAGRAERTTYLVIVEPIAASFGATTYVYASASGGGGSPALVGEVDLVALIAHDLPEDAAVTLVPQPAGTILTLTMAQPSCYVVGVAAQLVRTWRLSIQMAAGIQPRPVVGEVWIGSARTMLVGAPIMPIGGQESSPGQLSIEAGRKRREAVPDEARASTALALQFSAPTDAAFQQLRDEVSRLTRFGVDPLLLLPGEAFDGGGRVYHGRVEDRLAWSLVTRTAGGESLRTFALPFTEDPFPSP
jgi:hypothetical protein